MHEWDSREAEAADLEEGLNTVGMLLRAMGGLLVIALLAILLMAA